MPQPPKSKTLIAYLIILTGLVGGYFYYSYSGAGEVVVPAVPQMGKDDLSRFKDFKIDFSILDSSAYNLLKVYGELPVSIGTPGKRNIFAP